MVCGKKEQEILISTRVSTGRIKNKAMGYSAGQVEMYTKVHILKI